MIDKALLKEKAAGYGIFLPEAALEQFDIYAGLLVEWNQRMNLTAITQPDEIVTKHFMDSLLALKAAPIPQNAALIDVGTGAGFPGIPLKLARPDLRLTLLDSLNKRITFLGAVCQELGIEAETLHTRAEDAGWSACRERFDLAAARAVAHLRELCEYCLPLLKVGGRFLALKGQAASRELDEAGRAIALLGGRLEGLHSFQLPGGDGRCIVVIKKISQTPSKYPRPSAKIAKSPLA